MCLFSYVLENGLVVQLLNIVFFKERQIAYGASRNDNLDIFIKKHIISIADDPKKYY